VRVIDQYRVAKDDNGDSIHEPDRMDNEQCIGRLIGQVITVRLKTVKVVTGSPELLLSFISPNHSASVDSHSAELR